MTLNRDQILGIAPKTTEATVSAWGGEVRVRMLSALARAQLSEGFEQGGGPVQFAAFKARLVALTVVDDSGALVFTLDDVPALLATDASALDCVYEAAAKLNAIGEQAVEEAQGNSSGAPNSGSSSDSPSPSAAPSENSASESTPQS